MKLFKKWFKQIKYHHLWAKRKHVIIYFTHSQVGDRKFNEILELVPKRKVKKVMHQASHRKILLKNGTQIGCVPAFQSARGYRWDYAFVECFIDRDIFFEVILPTCRPTNKKATERLLEFYY